MIIGGSDESLSDSGSISESASDSGSGSEARRRRRSRSPRRDEARRRRRRSRSRDNDRKAKDAKARARDASVRAKKKARRIKYGPCPYAKGTQERREFRYREYRAQDGEKSYEKWEKIYIANSGRSKRSTEAVEKLQKEEYPDYHTEVSVKTPRTGLQRRLDLADDPDNPTKAIEHKMGEYTSRSPEINSEIDRDAELVEEGMEITWYFEHPTLPTRVSKPLLRDLHNNNIIVMIDGEVVPPPVSTD